MNHPETLFMESSRDMRFLTIKDPTAKDELFSIDFQETPTEYRNKRIKQLYNKYPIPPKGDYFWIFSNSKK